MHMLQAPFFTLRRLLRDDSAATSIEYAMIAAGISVAIVASLTSLGEAVLALFDKVKTALGA